MKIFIMGLICAFTLSASAFAAPKNKSNSRNPASADFMATSDTEVNDQDAAQKEETEVTFVSKASGDTDFSSSNRVTCEEVAKGPSFCKGKAQKCSDGSWKCKPNCFTNNGHKVCVH